MIKGNENLLKILVNYRKQNFKLIKLARKFDWILRRTM